MKKLSILLFFVTAFCTFSGNAQKKKLKISKYETSRKCTSGNPSSVIPGKVDSAGSRGVANNDKLWDNGTAIKVKFMNNVGSERVRNIIKSAAKNWETYANIKLDFYPDNEETTDIRILLGGYGNSKGHNSFVGLDNHSISNFKPTMNLDTFSFLDGEFFVKEYTSKGPFYNFIISKRSGFKGYNTNEEFFEDMSNYPSANKPFLITQFNGTVMHEFGHALGLEHEQSYPGAIKWNKDTVYANYLMSQGWDKKQVDYQVFEVADVFYTNGTAYDPKSIMQYAVDPWETLDGFSVPWNYYLSNGDKKIIAALYPKDRTVSALTVPIIQVYNYKGSEVKLDDQRQGIVLKPAFGIKTNALVGKIVVVARLVTEDGKYFIETQSKTYNWNGAAAVFTPLRLTASSGFIFNKAGANNLELLFPYDQIPAAAAGKKINVSFSVYQYDEVNDREKELEFSLLSSPLFLPKR